jgi:hypothetical protein
MQHIEVLDRFFYHLSRFFPYVVGIKIQGDDGNHDLPFLTEEDQSKTVTFLKHVYHNNQNLTFWLKTENDEEEISLVAENQDHVLSFQFQYHGPVFELLHPFSVIDGDIHYYSTDCGKPSDNGFYLQTEGELDITDAMRENYKFTNFCMFYYTKFDFLRLNEDLYMYNFQTFLPEDIDKVDLARLIIYLIARKTKRHELLNIKKEHVLNVSIEELEEQTVLNFSFDTYPIAGYISPKRKHISVVF